MNKINLAVVGFDRIGKIHAENIISAKDATLKMNIDPILHLENQIGDNKIKFSKNPKTGEKSGKSGGRAKRARIF